MILNVHPGRRKEAHIKNGGKQRNVMFGAEALNEIKLIRTKATGELISTSDAIRLAVTFLADYIRAGVVGVASVDQQEAPVAPRVQRDPVEESGL